MLKFQQKEKNLKKYFEILRKCALFDQVADQDLLPMLSCLGAKVEQFDKKYTIFAEGTAAKHIGIVLSGSVQIVQNDYYGNRSLLAGAVPAEMFGEAFACSETPSLPVAVIAAEPSEIMLIDCRRILHSCANACAFHQQMIFNLMKSLATKNILFHQKLEIVAKRSTREKLMAYLSMQAAAVGSRRFDIPFDRQDLADYLEVDRSGLSAEIGKMKREGILENRKNHFVLL